MTSNKRQRQLARAKHERQQARREAEASRRRRLTVIISSIVGVLLVVLLGWALVARQSASSTETASPTPEASLTADITSSPGASDSANPSESAVPTPSSEVTASADIAGVTCSEPPANRTDNLTYPSAPSPAASPAGKPVWNLTTNCGKIAIALDAAKAPATVASMAFLTGKGFYNDTKCHRLTTAGIFVLQCGDPQGTGSGGPGYTIPDENLPQADAAGTASYPAGTVAMANAGANTGGSQFFLVYQNSVLPPNYTVFGQITSGLNVVQYVASKGVEGGGTDGPPAQPVSIVTATVSGG